MLKDVSFIWRDGVSSTKFRIDRLGSSLNELMRTERAPGKSLLENKTTKSERTNQNQKIRTTVLF